MSNERRQVNDLQKEVLGCDHDVLVIPKYGSMSLEEAQASIELFAREVMPHI